MAFPLIASPHMMMRSQYPAHSNIDAAHCRRCKKVTHLTGDMAGQFGQGTIASLAAAYFMENSAERRQSSDPYCLDPPDSRSLLLICCILRCTLRALQKLQFIWTLQPNTWGMLQWRLQPQATLLLSFCHQQCVYVCDVTACWSSVWDAAAFRRMASRRNCLTAIQLPAAANNACCDRPCLNGAQDQWVALLSRSVALTAGPGCCHSTVSYGMLTLHRPHLLLYAVHVHQQIETVLGDPHSYTLGWKWHTMVSAKELRNGTGL